MPSIHKARPAFGTDELPAPTKGDAGELRRARKTRFMTDANIEPWAVFVMRRNRLDVVNAHQANLVGKDDRAVVSAAWRARRLLVTHDTDFLDDRQFPYHRCAGVLVLPVFSR